MLKPLQRERKRNFNWFMAKSGEFESLLPCPLLAGVDIGLDGCVVWYVNKMVLVEKYSP